MEDDGSTKDLKAKLGMILFILIFYYYWRDSYMNALKDADEQQPQFAARASLPDDEKALPENKPPYNLDHHSLTIFGILFKAAILSFILRYALMYLDEFLLKMAFFKADGVQEKPLKPDGYVPKAPKPEPTSIMRKWLKSKTDVFQEKRKKKKEDMGNEQAIELYPKKNYEDDERPPAKDEYSFPVETYDFINYIFHETIIIVVCASLTSYLIHIYCSVFVNKANLYDENYIHSNIVAIYYVILILFFVMFAFVKVFYKKMFK